MSTGNPQDEPLDRQINGVYSSNTLNRNMEGVSMDDAFDTSAQTSNGYDPYKVYRSTTNAKGFSARMRIALPPEAIALASEIAARRSIDGIKTAADMMRDAFIHRLHAYEEMLKTNDPLIAAQCMAVRRRMAVDANLDTQLQTRQADRERADKAMELWRVSGKEALPYVQEALDNIRTEEYRTRLARIVGLDDEG